MAKVTIKVESNTYDNWNIDKMFRRINENFPRAVQKFFFNITHHTARLLKKYLRDKMGEFKLPIIGYPSNEFPRGINMQKHAEKIISLMAVDFLGYYSSVIGVRSDMRTPDTVSIIENGMVMPWTWQMIWKVFFELGIVKRCNKESIRTYYMAVLRIYEQIAKHGFKLHYRGTRVFRRFYDEVLAAPKYGLTIDWFWGQALSETMGFSMPGYVFRNESTSRPTSATTGLKRGR
ncbi:hypothetical protein KDA14_04950 [Candidatus Saccharibacteria bacterium]|nr:hypothetical protein [Candidatus Saccharibacteria bacterium]